MVLLLGGYQNKIIEWSRRRSGRGLLDEDITSPAPPNDPIVRPSTAYFNRSNSDLKMANGLDTMTSFLSQSLEIGVGGKIARQACQAPSTSSKTSGDLSRSSKFFLTHSDGDSQTQVVSSYTTSAFDD